jgi:hypothetical protein
MEAFLRLANCVKGEHREAAMSVMSLLGPAPLCSPIPRDRVEAHRDLSCERYDVCLAYAAREDWAGWTCAHCARFQSRSGHERNGLGNPQPFIEQRAGGVAATVVLDVVSGFAHQALAEAVGPQQDPADRGW